MTSCCSWVSLTSIKSTITHHSSTFPNPRPSMIIASKVGLLMGDVALCVGRSWLFTDFFPSLDVIAVTLAFETLGHFFECWHSLGTLRMFLRCGFNHPFMDLKHAEWGFISSDGLNGSYLLHGCTLRTKICLGGIPDCKSLPGGAFELRWCLDAWDEQCIDDDGTLFQWVMILGSLVLFSSLRQQTPADSRLHQNWSCNASPWRFLSINHSYFLHEGYLKIYMIYITPYESDVGGTGLYHLSQYFWVDLYGSRWLLVGEGHVVIPAFFGVDPVGKRLRRVWFLQIWESIFSWTDVLDALAPMTKRLLHTFSVKCSPHSFPSCHFPFHHQRKTSEGGRDAGGWSVHVKPKIHQGWCQNTYIFICWPSWRILQIGSFRFILVPENKATTTHGAVFDTPFCRILGDFGWSWLPTDEQMPLRVSTWEQNVSPQSGRSST